ncbi:MAG: hypothetical protein AABX05_04915 [Nanoarchaeota archaeon]
MMPIEILAVIVSLLVLVKVSVILILGPKAWLKVGEFLLKRSKSVSIIYLILAFIAGYYLLTALTVVEVMAASLVIVLLLGVTLIKYYSELLLAMKKSIKTRKEVITRFWLELLIWVGLAVATLWQVLVR